jgi:hypothetical protein
MALSGQTSRAEVSVLEVTADNGDFGYSAIGKLE